MYDRYQAHYHESMRTDSKLDHHFSVRHISSCPRQLWIRSKSMPYSNPPSLAQWMMMEWGTAAEHVEVEKLNLLDPDSLGNSGTIDELIPKNERLELIVGEAHESPQAKYIKFGPNCINNLPIFITIKDVKRPLHGVIDILTFMYDHGVVFEVKETRGRSASNMRQGGGPWTSWLTQLYTYCKHVDLPGELHVWGRETAYHTKFLLDERDGRVCLDGVPIEIETNMGNMTLDTFISLRLQYLERILEADEMPGKASFQAGHRVIDPFFPDCPTPPDEIYRLVMNNNGAVSDRTSIKGEQFYSRRCYTCWDRDNCMDKAVSVMKERAF